MTIIYEIARVHAKRGGKTRVIVTQGTRHDYPVGECIEVPQARPALKWQKGIDAILGRIGLPRAFGTAPYRPACSAIPIDFRGTIFIHNNPVSVPLFRRKHPSAQVCLWANNELFRTYSARETCRVVHAADRVICCSEYIAADLRKRICSLPELRERVRVMHNGADVERFSPDPAKRNVTIPVVLFVGRVIPEKGPDLLLKAACKIYGLNRKFTVRIVGSSGFSSKDPLTAYEQELRRIAAPLGDAVVFQPFLDRARVAEEYRQASIFCAPSTWNEPVSLTVPEAIASGLATITTRRGGIPEVGGDAVLYFDPPNADGLAEHLAHLLDDPKARAEWSRKARERAQFVSWEHQYEILINALK